MKNNMHLALLDLILEEVCVPWRTFRANVIHKYTKPDAFTHRKAHTRMYARTHENTLGILHAIIYNSFFMNFYGRLTSMYTDQLQHENSWLLHRNTCKTLLPGIHACVTLTHCTVELTDVIRNLHLGNFLKKINGSKMVWGIWCGVASTSQTCFGSSRRI